MKKKALLIGLSALVFLTTGSITACNNQANTAATVVSQEIKSITVNMLKTSFSKGDVLANYLSANLSVEATFSNGQKATVTYDQFSTYHLLLSLKNPNQEEVSKNAAMNEEGSWTITIYSDTYTSIRESLSINVGNSIVAVTGITLDASSLTLTVGDVYQLNATISPANATNKNITWSTNNSSVATVSASGSVTALKRGSATITAKTSDGNKVATCQITINEKASETVSVTGISLNASVATLEVGETYQLNATITPANATNKNVIWSSADSSVATVSNNGLVTAIKTGTVNITAKSEDASKTAKCQVTVNETQSATTGSYELVTDIDSINSGDRVILASASNGVTMSTTMKTSAASSYLLSTNATFSSDKSTIVTLANDALVCTVNETSADVWTLANDSRSLLGSSQAKRILWDSGITNWKFDISSDGAATITNATATNGAIGYNYNGGSNSRFTTYAANSTVSKAINIYVDTSARVPTDPTAITLSETEGEVKAGKTKQLKVSYIPSSANQNKEITWSSSNSDVATVSDTGLVTVNESAEAGATAVISAQLTHLPNVAPVTFTLTVKEVAKGSATVMIYMSGNNLESEDGLASGDIDEILSVAGQPDDVNIIIETGGARKWENTTIDKNYLCRFHVQNKKLVLDQKLSKANMGKSSTLQSFLEWGITNYPSDNMSLIYWDHGGAMDGVCFDENYDDDGLTNDECLEAYQKAWENTGRTDKFSWVGYDACLMQVQDIAEFNSAYFDYQVASQESVSGYGWNYDKWIDNLYNHDDVESILEEAAYTLATDNYALSNSNNDATMSVLDLSKMENYRTAWENMTTALTSYVSNSSRFSSFKSFVNQVQKFGYVSYYGYAYNIFDVDDLLNNIIESTTYACAKEEAQAALDAFNELVIYNVVGKKSSGACGLCFYFPYKSNYDNYASNLTHFTNWYSFVSKY